ncbi:MAG: tyrosine-type recombinase/integrase, partial [Gammaproteobacteria bacterium]|nr:tyrosine-type recombinase/integrase [Gammaproteobacteria bacterium]
LNGRKLPGCGQATIRKTIVGLKASFNRAIKRGLLDSNPFVGQRLAKTQPKQKRIFSPGEIDALIAASPTLWWATFIRLAFTSGLRLGELLNTTWADIGESHITVTAKRPGTFTAGGRSYPVLAFSCKSHRERRVPLDPEAAKLLQRLKLKSGGSIYPFLSLDRLAVLAATRDTTQEINAAKLSNNVLRTFKLIQVQARAILAKQRGVGIDKVPWIVGCVHDMRKSFASLAAHHISMPELQKILGHSSIVTTSEFYVDVSDDLGDRLKVAFA